MEVEDLSIKESEQSSLPKPEITDELIKSWAIDIAKIAFESSSESMSSEEVGR